MKHWRIWLVALVIVSSVVFCADTPKEHIEHEGAYEGGPWVLPQTAWEDYGEKTND